MKILIILLSLFCFCYRETNGWDIQAYCDQCVKIVSDGIEWLEQGYSLEQIEESLVDMCVTNLSYTERVCRGHFTSHTEVVVWIYQAKNQSGNPLTAEEICGITRYPFCALNYTEYEWSLNLDFLGPKPTPEVPQVPPQGSPTMKILQITDIHIDPNYVPGYNAECGEPMCCRYDQGIPENISARAGYWGDYRGCDFPLHSFHNMLIEANTRHSDISYVIFSGDVMDHASWNNNIQYNSDLITYAQNEIKSVFNTVPIVFVIGNHESHPGDVFWDPLKTEVPQHLRTDWLYNLSSTLWGEWLPFEAQQDVIKGGFYSVEIQPGLYVIGINTMWCYTLNLWLLYDNVDPTGQLMWLANKLLEIESLGKKVHIIAHNPTGRSDCTHFWSKEYRRIIDRFENIIVAQFHGHTHRDHFSIYYDLNDQSRPTTVSFTAGSGTPFYAVNPNYRVYTVDPITMRPLDHETWYYNLTEANLNGNETLPNWQKLYSFNEAFGTEALFPQFMDTLVHQMANNSTLRDQYYRYYVKNTDPYLEWGCDATCMHDVMCETVTTVYNDTRKCNEIFPLTSPGC